MDDKNSDDETRMIHLDVKYLGQKPYELKEFYSKKFFDSKKGQQTLNQYFTAIARFGGPLAIMCKYNKPRNGVISNTVTFFTSDGNLLNAVELQYNDDVLCFEYLQNEQICFLTSTPAIYIVDPFRKNQVIKPHRLGAEFAGNIVSAKIFENSVAFLSKPISDKPGEEFRFYYVDNIPGLSSSNISSAVTSSSLQGNPIVQHKSFAKASLKDAPRDWVVIPKGNFGLQTLEIQATHPDCGIISITEQSSTLYYGLPEPSPQQGNSKQPQAAAPTPQNSSPTKQKSNLTPIKNIQYIAVSPSGALVAYLQDIGNSKMKLCVVSNDYEATTFRASEVNPKRFKPINPNEQSKFLSQRMQWCGDHCCILQGDKCFLMMGPNVSKDIQLGEDFTIATEIDGLRVITRKTNKMLRPVPPAYMNANSSLDSKTPAAVLFSNYQNLKEKQPFDDSNLRSNLVQLKQAVQDCMDTAEFVIDESLQQDYLKAASYGKTYIGPDSTHHDDFGLLCIKLRVVYNFKEQFIKRMITCAQVTHLLSGDNQQRLIQIMLRYDYHELAMNVCNQLDFKVKVRTHIFEHWAERVIENSSAQLRASDTQLSGQQVEKEDARVADKIIAKLRSEKNISFVNISKRAMKEGRQNLATKLLYEEPSAFKRVPVLIWMGKNCKEFEKLAIILSISSSASNEEKEKTKQRLESPEWLEEVEQKQALHFENALRQAERSRDSELIYICLKEMDACMKNEALKFHVLSATPIFANHYKNYLKFSLSESKRNRYISFLESSNSDYGQEKAFAYFSKSLEVSTTISPEEYLNQRLDLLKSSLKSVQGKPQVDDLLSFAMIETDQLAIEGILSQSRDIINKNTIPDLKEWTVNESLRKTIRYEPKQLSSSIKKFQASPKISNLLRVRNLIQEKDYGMLENFLTKEVNHKTIVIPYELVADLLIKAGAKEYAVRLICFMPKIDERVEILLKIDEHKKAVQEVINSKKNFELLDVIRRQTSDPSVLSYMDNLVRQHGPSKK